ncbi:MAG: hypothetical protein OEZ13_11475 [Spirochaetia bacterium]|nr:hypothetical protein [Spirochaetia bacterium]
MPNISLLATKWHKEQNKPAWHWCVFVRENNSTAVFDSNKNLKNNLRTDFKRIKPKWFIEVKL